MWWRWPVSLNRALNVVASQRMTSEPGPRTRSGIRPRQKPPASPDPVAKIFPSGLQSRHQILSACPVDFARSVAVFGSQTIAVLPMTVARLLPSGLHRGHPPEKVARGFSEARSQMRVEPSEPEARVTIRAPADIDDPIGMTLERAAGLPTVRVPEDHQVIVRASGKGLPVRAPRHVINLPGMAAQEHHGLSGFRVPQGCCAIP